MFKELFNGVNMIRKCIKCKTEKDHLKLLKPKTGYYWCDKCYKQRGRNE